jgi:hypothetical protein
MATNETAMNTTMTAIVNEIIRLSKISLDSTGVSMNDGAPKKNIVTVARINQLQIL